MRALMVEASRLSVPRTGRRWHGWEASLGRASASGSDPRPHSVGPWGTVLAIGPAQNHLLGSLTQDGGGGEHVGIDVGLELGEVGAEHVDQRARLGVVGGLVGPSLARVEDGRVDAGKREG